MIFRCNPLLLTFLLPLLITYCNREPERLLSSEQEEIIRAILRENGYTINDNESVEPFLYTFSSYEFAPEHDKYWLKLPAPGSNRLVLTDRINNLNQMFDGVIRSAGGIVDTIVILSDSIIKMKILEVGFNLKTIPMSIRQLRCNRFGLSNNQISYLPDEIMELSLPPVFFDTLSVSIMYNKIDTATISDTLYKWLDKYAGTNWVRSQNPD